MRRPPAYSSKTMFDKACLGEYVIIVPLESMQLSNTVCSAPFIHKYRAMKFISSFAVYGIRIKFLKYRILDISDILPDSPYPRILDPHVGDCRIAFVNEA